MQKFKNIVIGFGKGGKTLAKALSQQGESVLVVEKSDKMYGGTCINIGCIPSKSLVVNGEKRTDFVKAVSQKEALVSMLRDKNYHMLADDKNITVLNGTAKFVANHQIKVALPNGQKEEFEAERIFINTGATPVELPIPGLKESKYAVYSTGAMELEKKT